MIMLMLLIFPVKDNRADHAGSSGQIAKSLNRSVAKSLKHQPFGIGVLYSRASLAGSTLRKISHTPARTKAPPTSDHRGNVSPPSNHPNITAPGGGMSEMVCRFVTNIRGSSQ